jgi:hypothetical protein
LIENEYEAVISCNFTCVLLPKCVIVMEEGCHSGVNNKNSNLHLPHYGIKLCYQIFFYIPERGKKMKTILRHSSFY